MKIALGTKLVLIIEAVVIIVSVLGGLVTTSVLNQLLTERARAQLESVSVLKEYSMSGYFEEVSSEIDHITRGDYAREQLWRFFITQKPDDRAAIIDMFSDILEENGNMSEIFLIDLGGFIIASTKSMNEGKIIPDDSFFATAKSTTTIQAFFYDVAAAQIEVIAGTAVRNGSGEVVGVLAGKFSVADMSRLMVERSGLGETGETYLVNPLNIVVTDLAKEPGAALRKTLYLPQITNCLRGETSFSLGKDYHGDRVFGYYRWLPNIESCLVTQVSEAEVVAPIRELVFVFLSGTLLIGLAVGLLGYVAGRIIIRPLSRLRDIVLKIKDGDFTVTADTYSRDEIGDVALAFNDMAAKLRTLYEGLEDEVKKKTFELSGKVDDLARMNISLEEKERAVINLLEDIEEEKARVEQTVVERTRELREEKARLLASINSLHFGFAIVDMAHEIILKNTVMSRLLGVHESDRVSIQDVSRILGGGVDLRAEVEQCIWSGAMREVKEILFKKSFLRGIIAPIMMEREAVGAIGYILLLEDITEAKVAERSREEFFAVASHELRTPLTAIRGNVEMILDIFREKIVDQEMFEMLGDIDSSSIRLINIVNDFLEVSRLEHGKVEMKKEGFAFGMVAEKVVKDLQGIAAGKGVALSYREQGALSKASADLSRVEQVLINLVGNALKFTERGSVDIEASQKDSFIEVVVRDTGLGIAPENQPLLFRKFQQAGEKVLVRDASKGTGLGLYISKLLVEGMGGAIELLESAPGKGSSFKFSLPVVSG